MTILTQEQIEKIKNELDSKGEKKVREDKANHIYDGEGIKKIVENWLDEKEREKQEISFQQQLDVAKSQACIAKVSAMISMAGAIITIALHFIK